MPQEHIFSDFSGGMNALAAVDKLDPKECLLAENCRLDETGNILSAGAFTKQNAVVYSDSLGNKNIHSLYWNPSIGGIAGIGQDVFQGFTLGGLASKLAGKNTKKQKMSFASAPNRVYFDVSSVGYWSDLNNLIAVDWAPPSAQSSIATGPNNGTLTGANALGTGTATGFGFSVGTQAMQGVQFTVVATTVAVNTGTTAAIPYVVEQASLLVGGVVVGTSSLASANYFGTGTTTSTDTFTFGNANSLWGYAALSTAQVNASSFGVVFGTAGQSSGIIARTLSAPTCTVYQQQVGFVAGTGAAGTLTGTYTWKITFVAANGEESDGSVASTSVVLSAQQGTLTAIGTGDNRTTSRNVYRKGGLLTSYYLVGSIPDNTSTTYSDNQTDIAALTAGVILAGDVPGDYPNARLGNTQVRFPVLHYDRVFWVNQNQPNQLIWSKPLNGFAYPVINSINVGDSSAISRTVSIFGELIIFKTNSQIWRLTGTDETSFDLTQTPAAASTDESFAITPLPDKILFHNRWGFWVFNGYTSQPLTTKLDLWMKQDDRTGEELFGVNGFHPPELASLSIPLNFDSTGNSEKFYFSYAEAGKTQNNAVLVFDVKHGNITKRAGFNPLSLAIDPVTGFVYMGDNQGFISLLDDWNGTTQGGAAVNFDFQTGYLDLQRGSNKALWLLEFFLDTDGQSLTPTVYYDNGNANEALAPISTASMGRVQRTLESTAARKHLNFSVRFNGSINPVNSSGSPTIQIVHIKAKYDLRVGRAREGQ
jgi:hypothetical protein